MTIPLSDRQRQFVGALDKERETRVAGTEITDELWRMSKVLKAVNAKQEHGHAISEFIREEIRPKLLAEVG